MYLIVRAANQLAVKGQFYCFFTVCVWPLNVAFVNQPLYIFVYVQHIDFVILC